MANAKTNTKSKTPFLDGFLSGPEPAAKASVPTRLWGTVLPDRPPVKKPSSSGPLFGPVLPARKGNRPFVGPNLPVGIRPGKPGKRAKPESEYDKLMRSPDGGPPTTVLELAAAYREDHKNDAPGWSPGEFLLKVVSIPGYVIGDHMKNPLAALNPLRVAEIWNDPGLQKGPGTVLRDAGALDFWPEKWGLRSIAETSGNILFDPSTWATFGAGAGAKVATAAGSKIIMDAAKAGERVAHGTVGKAGVARELTALKNAPAVSIGLKVPFGPVIPIAESTKLASAGIRVGKALGDNPVGRVFRSSVLPAGSAKAANKTGISLLNSSVSEKNKLARVVDQYAPVLKAAAKSANMSVPDALNLMVRWRARGMSYQLPVKLRQLGDSITSEIQRVVDPSGLKQLDVDKIFDTIYLPPPSMNKPLQRIGMDVTRSGDAEKAAITRFAQGLQQRVGKAAKGMDWTPEQAFTAIAKQIDNPGKYHLDRRLMDVRNEAVAFLRDIYVKEADAGLGGVYKWLGTPQVSAEKSSVLKTMAGGHVDPPSATVLTDNLGRALRQKSLDDLWDAGASVEVNIARLVEVRGHASVKARVMQAFEEAAAQLPVSTHSAADIDRVKRLINPSISGPGVMLGAARFINGTGTTWKKLTLLTPAYHVRNMQSDLLSAFWAGARDPRSFLEAGRILMGKDIDVTVNGVKQSGKSILAQSEAGGVIRIGNVGGEINAAANTNRQFTIGNLGLKPSFPGRGKVAGIGSTVGSAREDMVRLGLYIERLKRGDDIMTAAKTTRDFLFDYGDVGQLLKLARKFWLPFITYPVKATAMVARQVGKNPGTLANTDKVIRALNEASGANRQDLTDADRSSFGVPVPDFVKQAVGLSPDQPFMYNPKNVSPLNATDSLRGDSLSRVAGSLGGTFLNPIPKLGIEEMTGRSMKYGTQLSQTAKDTYLISMLKEIGVPIPGAKKKRVLYPKNAPDVEAYSRLLDAGLRLLPPYGYSAQYVDDVGSNNRLDLLTNAFGIPITTTDRAKAEFDRKKRAKEQASQARQDRKNERG